MIVYIFQLPFVVYDNYKLFCSRREKLFWFILQEHGLTDQDIEVPHSSLKAISMCTFNNEPESESSSVFLRGIPLEKCSSHKESNKMSEEREGITPRFPFQGRMYVRVRN